jgi:UPF0716 protein FxsA
MWLMLAVLALPLIEIALFVVVGGGIGLWLTLVWVVASAALGVLILKRVSMKGPISLDRDVRSLRDPMSPIARRALTVLASGLLILPGFFTDTLGLLLLVPQAQMLIIGIVARRVRQGGAVQHGQMTIDGEWSEVTAASEERVSSNSADAPPSGWTRH